MADSETWHGLAEQFRALPADCRMLRADRYYEFGTGPVGQWTLVGTASSRIRFEALARRAASEIADPPTTDLLTAWLEVLMKEDDSEFRSNPIATEDNPDGSHRRHYVTGSMHELPTASANYCQTLESAALQAEFEEKQRDNPKNWSEFRQRVEAFESMKEVMDETPYQISEAIVRKIIADMDGIKPEDVTMKRIGFEIAALGGPKRRRIQVIPSTPPPESPPVTDAKASNDVTERVSEVQPEAAPPATIATQIERLRDECLWTNEDLAEAVNLSSRQVSRHVSGESAPYKRNIAAYERVFSNKLKRQVFIRKMS